MISITKGKSLLNPTPAAVVYSTERQKKINIGLIQENCQLRNVESRQLNKSGKGV